MTARVLVAAIGNVFFGDDGFGVTVAERLAGRPLPDGVVVGDYGVRGLHLALDLSQGYGAAILIDALPLGNAPPGTIAVLEPEALPPPGAPLMDGHSMNPTAVLAALAALGATVGRVLVVGCQPATLEEGMGLSVPVAAAVDRAVGTVIELLGSVAIGEE